jgi:NAD(P)-dependent dehydrogenase (short-subunit alcohol dehydrogenase family)
LPGIIETDANHDRFANPGFLADAQALHPLGLGRPEDVADTVEFLTSEGARWMTGQEIVVDGGQTARKCRS